MSAAAVVVVLAGIPVTPPASAAGPVTSGSYADPNGTVYSVTSASGPVAISQPGFTAPNASVASVRVSTGFFTFVVDSAGELDVIAPDGSTSRVSPIGAGVPGQPLFATVAGGDAVVGLVDRGGLERVYGLIIRDVNVPKGPPKPPVPPPGGGWPELASTSVQWYQPGTTVVGVGDQSGDFAMFSPDAAGGVRAVWQKLDGKGADSVLVPGAASVGSAMSVTFNYSAASLPTAISLFFVTTDGAVAVLHPTVGGGLADAPAVMPWGAVYQTTKTGHLAASTDGTRANVAYLTSDGTMADLGLNADGKWQSAALETSAGAGWPGAAAAAGQVPGQINVLCGASATGQPAWVTITGSSSRMIPDGPPNVTVDTRFTAG